MLTPWRDGVALCGIGPSDSGWAYEAIVTEYPHARGENLLARPSGRALREHRFFDPTNHMFQSSPDLQVGRYVGETKTSSVHAGFNPRPTFRSGATATQLNDDLLRLVSILARPSGRALRWNPSSGRALEEFQSSPDLQVGRYGSPQWTG